MRIKRFGWVRDIPDQRDFRYEPPPRLAEALPAKTDLRAGFPGCYNQGELGSCTANAIAGALQFLERKEGATPGGEPSETRTIFGYSLAGLAGACLVTGIVCAIRAKLLSDDYQDPTNSGFQQSSTHSQTFP